MNKRTLFLEIGVFIVFAYLMYAKRIVTLSSISAVYIAMSFTRVFSDITLDVRSNLSYAGESTTKVVNLTLERLMSTETLITMLFPFIPSQSSIRVTSYFDPTDTYWIDFLVGQNTLGSRFVHLAYMDMVVSYFPHVDTINWNEILNVLLAMLPSVGQTKNLIYNDQLTWYTGLRDYDNIGAPLITAAGEFYTMGGFTILCAIMFICTTILLLEYRILERILRSTSLTSLIFCRYLGAFVFTSTSLSLASLIFRTLPTCIIIVSISLMVAKSLSTRRLLPKQL